MSTLQFPANPMIGDTYDWDAYKYVWDGEKWKTIGIGYNPVNDLRDELEPRISNNESKVFEALRRSYAEAGYNLVDGSFEAGGTVATATDVLLYEADGKAYAYTGTLPHTVVAGSSPSAEPGMWTDKSKSIYGIITTAQLAAGVVGAGAVVTLSDRGMAIFNVVNGGVANGVDILSAGGGNTAVLNRDQKIYAEHLGVVAGSFSAENKAAVVNAIKYSSVNKTPVHFKNARYPAWNDYTIDVPGAEVVGAGMPNYKSDLSGLVDGTGTIFDGRLMFRGDDITLIGFGADAGTSSITALVQDAIVVFGNEGSTIEASVINHRYKDLIGVVATPDSAFHGILLQGINHLEFDNLVSVNGLFGTVIKCQNVIGGRVVGINQGEASCYIKGDIGPIAGGTYGVVENVSIDEVIYTGSGTNNEVSACKIHGSTATVSNVNVGTVTSTEGGVALHVRGGDGLTQVVGVNICSINGRLNHQELIVDAVNPDSIYGVNIGQITTYNPRRGVIAEARTVHSLNVHVGSIVGTNTGTKEIADLDVVLRGGFNVDNISVSSNNLNPTVFVSSLLMQKVTNSNIPLYYEEPLTLLNGYVNFDPDNVFRLIHNGDGFGFAGRIKTLAATDTLICNLPAVLSCKQKLISVPCVANDSSYNTAFIYIDGVTVSLLSPTANTLKWLDMSQIFVNFKSYLM